MSLGPTSRKSRSYYYFDAYHIVVVTEYPLGDILHNKEVSARIIKWAIELGTYTIDFWPRHTIKLQALTDLSPSGSICRLLSLSTTPSIGPCTSMSLSTSMVLGQAYISSCHQGISFTRSYTYTSQHSTILLNTKRHFTVFI